MIGFPEVTGHTAELQDKKIKWWITLHGKIFKNF